MINKSKNIYTTHPIKITKGSKKMTDDQTNISIKTISEIVYQYKELKLKKQPIPQDLILNIEKIYYQIILPMNKLIDKGDNP